MLPALFLLLASPAVPRIAVLDVKARVGVTTELAQGITDDLVVEVRRQAKGMQIISAEEIRSMLGFAQQKQKLGCQEMSCLAEIGGALGADLLVIGTLGKFGATYLLSLQLIETRAAKVKQQASLKLTGKSDDELLEAVSKAVEQLFPPAVVPAPVAATTAPIAVVSEPVAPKKSHILPWTLIGVGAASAVVAAVGGIEVLNYLSFNNSLTNGTESAADAAQAQSKHGTANAWAATSLVLVGVAAACTVGAVITW
jgi:hypothetical protein